MKRFLIPLGLFFVLVGFLAWGLKPGYDPREIPSPLVGKPAPLFELPQLMQPEKKFSPADMKGKVWLLNVWASWCVSCRAEHPLLVSFAQQGNLPIVGLSYKEVRGGDNFKVPEIETAQSKAAELALGLQRAETWLRQHGNPYTLSVMDIDGRVGIDYGVYGVPETFLIDKNGVIRFKQSGPVTREVFDEKILPKVKELEKS
ncbi:MAG: DsbE family thiol:disulfide interchange protein [Sterolibacterium sp.]|nr:DsbE family thiol:disulfide interchange protein [Sterolibacterium sp.]